MSEVRIAVVGAGVAGLACARELARAEARVTVFEKSRGLGGRLGTRRDGDGSFDHGAQFITARSRAFSRYIEIATRAGVLERWRPRIMEDDRAWDEPIDDWFVGVPGMSAAVRPMARGVEVRTGTWIRELRQVEGGWEVRSGGAAQAGMFDAVAVAAPAPQAHALLRPHGRTFRHLARVTMAPCWALLLAFEQPVAAGADVRRWTHGALKWAACDSSKLRRASGTTRWVVHAAPGWSREHLEVDAAQAARLLLHEFAVATDARLPTPVSLQAHRWRHAQVEQPLGLPCLVDEELAVGACGDWCIAPRVEAAFESGRALAHSLLSMLGLSTPALLR